MDEQQLITQPPEQTPVQQAEVLVVNEQENKPEPREVAYVIKDIYFPDFDVVMATNAWWMNRARVEKLIDGFKSGLNVSSACVYAGITRDQYKYFCKLNPDFMLVKSQCEEVPNIRWFATLNKGDSEATARWWIERRDPRFSQKVKLETDPLEPTVQINQQNNINVIDTNKIEGLAIRLLEGFLAKVSNQTEQTGNGVTGDAPIVATQEANQQEAA